MTRITGILLEDQNTFFIISRSVLLQMRNVSVVEEIKTRVISPVNFFFSENPAVCEIV